MNEKSKFNNFVRHVESKDIMCMCVIPSTAYYIKKEIYNQLIIYLSQSNYANYCVDLKGKDSLLDSILYDCKLN